MSSFAAGDLQSERTPTAPRLRAAVEPRPEACLVDTTMLFTPASGGVKRYLLAKRAWLAVHRPMVLHRLVLPAQERADEDPEISWVHSPAVPLGNGYRCPLSAADWAERIQACRPSLIEAGDPYAPGLAALRAGRACGAPVIGFCHSDPPLLAELYFGGLASRLARRLWIKRCRQFDAVLAPSDYMAGILRDAGLSAVQALPLGVDRRPSPLRPETDRPCAPRWASPRMRGCSSSPVARRRRNASRS